MAEEITNAGAWEISPDELTRLARLVEENGLSELRIEEGDLRVTLRTASYRAAFGPVANVVAGVAAPMTGGEVNLVDSVAATNNSAAPSSASANLISIEAPIMGVFYRSSAPGDPSFVEVGDIVEVGQTVGVIEAMKVFSEVPADHAGRVREIPALNGGLVQPGEPLIVLEAV